MTPLRGRDLDPDPVREFGRWHTAAGTDEMAVATVRPDGTPSCRMVLLKGYAEGRFVFFTDQQSDKAVDILLNPSVSLLFRWPPSSGPRDRHCGSGAASRDRPVLADAAAPVTAVGLGFSPEPSPARPCRARASGLRSAPFVRRPRDSLPTTLGGIRRPGS